MARRIAPLVARQLVAQVRRRVADRSAGLVFADQTTDSRAPVFASIEQTIVRGELYCNKVTNIALAIAAIDGSVIAPGQTWSFWRRIGRPTSTKGYLEGRSIRDGRLARELGGGLCQLSGLLHHVGLVGGLVIAERHAHSVDIYREEDRYTPLGADATVVWGAKDLRLLNSRDVSIVIRCRLDPPRLVAELQCERKLRRLEVQFVRGPVDDGCVRVLTIVDGLEVAVSEYVLGPGLSTE